MADLKVSQEVDLGLAGIDGTVEYRVIKGGSTFKQAYADLFSYINSSVTLQMVLDNSHDLVDGVALIGTGAGISQTGTFVTAIGENAAQDNDGSWVDVMGYEAGVLNIGDFVVGIGYYAARNNEGEQVLAIGSASAQENIGNNLIAIGLNAARLNSGDNCIIIGNEAAYDITFNVGSAGDNLIAIGKQSARQNLGIDNIAIGTNSIDNISFGAVIGNSIGIGKSALLDASGELDRIIAIGGLAGSLVQDSSYSILIGEEAGLLAFELNNSVVIGYKSGQSATGENNIFIGEQAGLSNAASEVVAIGSGAGNANQEPNQFMIATVNLPVFANDIVANAFYSGSSGLAVGSTYLYRDASRQQIGYYSA